MLRNNLGRFGGLISLALVLMLSGCGLDSLSTMSPVGPVGDVERDLTIFTLLAMLFVLIPILVLTLGIAWRYRASNTNSTYTPKWGHSWIVEMFVWGGPIVILVILSVVAWISTHDLDPYKAIKSDAKPVHIQAVATQWKWIFIYPEQGVASVNEFAFPVNVPLDISLTSDNVMNSFMIQRMGTQIFAMSGMQTKLHLLSRETGDLEGGNYQYTGHGFSKMRFTAKAMTEDNYKQWLQKVRSQGTPLDFSKFKQLAKPSEIKKPIYYSQVTSGLFGDIIDQFHNSGVAASTHEMPGMGHDMKSDSSDSGHATETAAH
ncbi:MAG: ubiquinol oxidase subunit II [Salinisphaera sp.]|jgi:cytochrome o ubiquinol oxidase subunit 2|nr:ubiquinol oxidase subunit II [Salinisphaera sp.]